MWKNTWKQCLYWIALLFSWTVVVVNVQVLNRDWDALRDALTRTTSTKFQHTLRKQDFMRSSRKAIIWNQRRDSSTTATTTATATDGQPPDLIHRMDPRAVTSYSSYAAAARSSGSAGAGAGSSLVYRRSRTLMGIMSADTRNDAAYRKRHRELFTSIWKDTRVCSLAQLRALPEYERRHCQLIYTFVIGAADDPEKNSPTQIVNASIPLYRTTPLVSKFPDINQDDVTVLNIKENMNDGKSPTFFYFASTILQEFNLDYAMKFDGDSILHLHDWFLFAHHHLPPRPYNSGIVAGALRHKAFWPAPADPKDIIRLESHWQTQYEGIHLYLAGQCYLLSLDMCQVVAQEAQLAGSRIAPGGYLEGHEDHDTTSMIFFSQDHPVHMLTIGKSQRFWEHPVKGQPRWERIKLREMARMNGQIFENKQLRLYMEE